jgi:hypothetical protein
MHVGQRSEGALTSLSHNFCPNSSLVLLGDKHNYPTTLGTLTQIILFSETLKFLEFFFK